MINNPHYQALLTDPSKLEQRNAEIHKTFEQAKLTPDEAILVMDKLNNHVALQTALTKLAPFITK